MSLGQIGQNGANEFFETMLYMTAYTEAREQIQGFTKDIDNPIVQDALEGAMNIIAMGVVFKLIQSQEAFIEKIFSIAKGLVVILLASGFGQKIAGKLGGLKGFKLFKKLEMFKSSFSDRVSIAQLVVNGAGQHFTAERTGQSVGNTMSAITQQKEHIVNKEMLNHQVGAGMASRYNETLLFKLFTKSFTANDEVLMKKILGRDTATELNVDDLNKVADFLFVTDTSGNITGLSEQLFSLINGLGYVHNK